MKTNIHSLNSFFYSLLDKYIYYVVVKKCHKQLTINNSQEEKSVSNSQRYAA
jgi:hypothetical protein